MSLEHRQFRFRIAQSLQEHRQFQLHRTPRPNRQHKLFNIRRPDQRTSECKRLSGTRIPTKQAADGKKWKNELLTRFRYFRISNTQDRIDALHIYGGEQIRELIESLESVHTPSSAELQNEYEKIIAKLDNHFIPMVNPDCARSKLEKMCQKEGESVAQYHVRLRLQVAKCGFTDPDDVIRSKILQTMRDKKLRREAMVKRYTLQQLLEHAANREDIDRQAQDMEQKLALVPDQVNRIHPKKTRKSKNKRKPKPPQDDKKENACQFCGIDHKGPRSNCPASGKTCALCSKKVILLACVKTKRTKRTLHRSHGQPQSTSRKRNRRSHPIRISPSRSE